MKKQFIFAVVAFFCTSCGKDIPDFVPDPSFNPQNLKELPFLFGAAVNDRLLLNFPAYKATLTNNFNSVTAESSMKFIFLQPSPNTWDFKRADNVVSFAKENGLRIHGHTLIWHNSLPTWVLNFEGNAAAWEKIFKDYIRTVMIYFKGITVSWDVVNEAINDDGTLRNTIWLQKIGPNYIAKAFEYAHAADPNALLFYNDYGQEKNVQKRNAIFNLVTSLKAKGVPIHGIGLQMHLNHLQDNDGIVQAIVSAVNTGLKVHISELDVALNPQGNTSAIYTSDMGERQKSLYKSLVQAYLLVPENQRFGITTWGVDDGNSYLRRNPDWPLMFDANFQPKPAYFGVLEGSH